MRPPGLVVALRRAALLVVLSAVSLVALAAIVLPAVAGGTARTVETGSMRPHYPPGTLVITRPVAAQDIRPGDVIAYQLRSGEPTVVTHRVVRRVRGADGAPRFITRGDANAAPDPDLVRGVQLRGRLWYAVPWIGWVAAGVDGPWRSVAVQVLVVGLLGYAARMYVSAARERGQDRRRGRRDAVDPPLSAYPEGRAAGAPAAARAEGDPRV